jgi:hypothetical protein
LAGNSLKGTETNEESRKSPARSRVLDQAEIAGGGKGIAENVAAGQSDISEKPAAPKIATESLRWRDEVQESVAEDRAGQIYRYQQRLEQQQAQVLSGGYGLPLPADPAKPAPYGAPMSGEYARDPSAPKDAVKDIDINGMDRMMRRSKQGGMKEAEERFGSMMGRSDMPPGASTPVPQVPGGMGAGGMSGMGSMNNLGIAVDNSGSMNRSLNAEAIYLDNDADGTVIQVPLPGHLASLDTELPVRGREFLFTTPRGEIEITAQSISVESIERLTTIAVLLAVAFTIWFAARLLSKRSRLLRQM